MHFPEIRTERLLLRRLQPSDWEVISYLRTDKDVNTFVKRSSAESKEKALEFIAKINTDFHNQELYYWAITNSVKTEMIGSICLWNFSKNKKVAEVGYDLNPKFQGKGIMNESLENVLDFGFQALNLDVIAACTHRQNKNSKKLLERNGFRWIENKKDEDNQDNLVYEIKKASI